MYTAVCGNNKQYALYYSYVAVSEEECHLAMKVIMFQSKLHSALISISMNFDSAYDHCFAVPSFIALVIMF